MHNALSRTQDENQSLCPDRRRGVRYACILEARSAGKSIPVGTGWVARITDISITGIGLHFGQKLPDDSDLVLGIHGKDYTLEPVQVRVIRCLEQPGGSWFMGAAFVTPLEEEQLQRLLS